MRTLCLSLLTLASLSAVAAAQPSLTATARTTDQPATYLELGAMAGFDPIGPAVAADVGGGIQLADSPLWLRGEVLHGESSGFFTDLQGTFDQARLGLEARGCKVHGIVCFVGGVDAAVQHKRVTGTGSSLFVEDTNEPVMTTETTAALGIGRIGLDIGGRHLRYRPSLEVGFGVNGVETGTFVNSLAWQF